MGPAADGVSPDIVPINTLLFARSDRAAITVVSGGRYTPQAGGVPIRRNGTVIGAAGFQRTSKR